MASMNFVALAGNLTQDPEIKQIDSGTTVGDLRLAVNEKYRTQQGEDKESVCYVDVVVWGRLAENCGQYLQKGSAVLLEGKLQYDQWETDGQKRSKLRVRAQRVQFLKLGEQAHAATPPPSEPPDLSPDDDPDKGLPF